jgi:hypothetical protein|tara:strand:+ start:80 stop:277 length:198 start_codon:yes stop_codon:yes gene_type:complete
MPDITYAVVGKSDNKVRNIVLVDDAVPGVEQWQPNDDEIAIKIDPIEFSMWTWDGEKFFYVPPSE